MDMAAKAYQVVGYKNSGKTTLICKLLPLLTEQGLRVGTVKHDAHGFEADVPDTDTWKHRKSGSVFTAITSGDRTAIMMERPSPLRELIREAEKHCDLVLVEGFKNEDYPKLLLIRHPNEAEELLKLSHVDAIAWWPEAEKLAAFLPLPRRTALFSIGDEEGLLRHLHRYACD